MARLKQLLPAQAALGEFIHNNALRGLQHLPFTQALAEASRLSGAQPWLDAATACQLYAQGRIQDADLKAAVRQLPELAGDTWLTETQCLGERALRRGDVLRAAVLHPPSAINARALRWKIEAEQALQRFDPELDATTRAACLAAASAAERGTAAAEKTDTPTRHEAEAVAALWAAACAVMTPTASAAAQTQNFHSDSTQAKLASATTSLHASSALNDPNLDFSGLFASSAPKKKPWEEEAPVLWRQLSAGLGETLILSDLLYQLTGQDIRQAVLPQLIRHLAAHLDQGIAAWPNPARAQGFYAAWRASALNDWDWTLNGLSGARAALAELPASAEQAIINELSRLGPDAARSADYLLALALSLPGWAGLFLQHALKESAGQLDPSPPESRQDTTASAFNMLDYLAVHLVLERLYAEQLVRSQWQLPLLLSELDDYFMSHPAELWVRHAYGRSLGLNQGSGATPQANAQAAQTAQAAAEMPDDLLNELQYTLAAATRSAAAEEHSKISADDWQRWAERLAQWRSETLKPSAQAEAEQKAVLAWPLFRLAQALALNADALHKLGNSGARALLDCAYALPAQTAAHLRLLAYERHYEQNLFAALAANHARISAAPDSADATSASAHANTQAQFVFCMDDREEGIRRHLEELNPALTTFGSAGSFNLPLLWQGLDETQAEALCPVSVSPRNRVVLHAAAPRWRRAWRLAWQQALHGHQAEHSGWKTPLLSVLAAPFGLLNLIGNTLAPGVSGRLRSALAACIDGQPTQLSLSLDAAEEEPKRQASKQAGAANAELETHMGFSLAEKIDCIGGLLRSIGLTGSSSAFAPFVILVGHGSDSRNNPHLVAYHCSACRGRHGGPNARIFAALANQAPVRAGLAAQGIVIPASTYFIGAEHNTCDESFVWYALDQLPQSQEKAFKTLRREVDAALGRHASERCQRFTPRPNIANAKQAKRHLSARRHDFAQARAELGHTNLASALIGRRRMSRGLCLERRSLLISYDPSTDQDGAQLEPLLCLAAPVSVGISLDYFFSKADNERFGCGSKITHNLVGRFGVMDGTQSDLRIGLPSQMVEQHEAMRLLLVVEHSSEVIDAIYQRQSMLQELVGNGWLLLAAQCPHSGQLKRFRPGLGWQKINGVRVD